MRFLIKSREYDILSEETKNKIINQQEANIKDLVSSPIIIKNKNNLEIISEKALHQLIMGDISSFCSNKNIVSRTYLLNSAIN